MSKKTDVIEQARLAAYFSEMQEEFFEDKLRRIVSLFPLIFTKYCNYRPPQHVLPYLTSFFLAGLQVCSFIIQPGRSSNGQG